MNVLSPSIVKVRSERRRIAELKEFLDKAVRGDTYLCTNGKRIVIREVRRTWTQTGAETTLTLAYMGETKTWTVER